MYNIFCNCWDEKKSHSRIVYLRRITDGVSCTCAFWRSGDQNAAPMFHSIHHLSQTEGTQTHSHKQLTQNIFCHTIKRHNVLTKTLKKRVLRFTLKASSSVRSSPIYTGNTSFEFAIPAHTPPFRYLLFQQHILFLLKVPPPSPHTQPVQRIGLTHNQLPSSTQESNRWNILTK